MATEWETKRNDDYKRQMRLSLFNIMGEVPNFSALLFSAITTRAVLVFVDLIDTAGNLFRNIHGGFMKNLVKGLRA